MDIINPHGHSTIKQSKDQDKKLCYIYRHIRLDKNEVFYIGKGTNIDGNYERSKNTHRSNPHWRRVINKTEYIIEIMLDGLTEQEANKKEVEFILLYGRRDLKTGTLVNLTNGGEGTSGIIRSPESIEKNRKANIGRKDSEETKRKKSGKIHTEETRKKMSNSAKGHTRNLGRKHTDETRKKMSDAHKDKKHTEEARKKMSDAQPKKKVGKYKDGILTKEYPSIVSTKLDDFDPTSVSKCCRGVYEYYKGYQWKFIL